MRRPHHGRSTVEIDLDAIAQNVRMLLRVADGAALAAVVKADAYGHGAIEVARTVIAAGASVLAVARFDEGMQLRDAGIDAPIWLLSEPADDEWPAVVAYRLEPSVYNADVVDRAAAVADADRHLLPVHLVVDTGMHRVGVRPERAAELARRIVDDPSLHLASVWTHLAVADEPEDPFTGVQLDRFDGVLADLADADVTVPVAHAANSAGTIAHPRARYDLVRCGISLYGLPPAPALAGRVDLRPAMRWTSRVSHVQHLAAGERVSYGRRGGVEADTVAATVPVGYADGYRRATWESEPVVLIGGVRRRILGVVTMDQMVVDCGSDPVAIGDEVVLVGRQGDEEVTASDLAAALGTIDYEVVCDVSARVSREHVGAALPSLAGSVTP